MPYRQSGKLYQAVSTYLRNVKPAGCLFPCWVSQLCTLTKPFSFFATFQDFFILLTFFFSLSRTDYSQHSVWKSFSLFPFSEFPTTSSLPYIISTVFITYICLPFLFFLFCSFFSKLRQIQGRCPPSSSVPSLYQTLEKGQRQTGNQGDVFTTHT